MEQNHGGNIYESEEKGRKLTDFSANINPLGMPKGIKKAVIDELSNSERYPDIRSGKLLRALAEVEKIGEDNIIIGNGAGDIIYSLCFSMRFKNALIMDPTFSEYKKALKAAGSQVKEIPVTKDKEFNLCKENLALITNETDALFLCQPNNPTGILIDTDMLNKIVIKCRENHVFIVIDECFLEFIEDKEKYSLKKYLDEGNIFIVKSFTKLYAMAGIRLGYGICADKKIIEGIKNCRQPWSVSNLAEAAGLAALKENEFVSKSLNLIKEEKTFLIKSLEDLSIKIYGSSANYIFFYCNNCFLYEKLLEKDILIRNCKSYKSIPDGFYRIAVKSHKENEMLISALKNILKGE